MLPSFSQTLPLPDVRLTTHQQQQHDQAIDYLRTYRKALLTGVLNLTNFGLFAQFGDLGWRAFGLTEIR